MASGADSEVVSSEGAFAVMTRHATQPTPCRMMIERFGCRYLPTLRHSGSYLMTLIARHLLVFRMTEANTIRLREDWRSRIAAELMTRAT